jgi:hypothetical protein
MARNCKPLAGDDFGLVRRWSSVMFSALWPVATLALPVIDRLPGKDGSMAKAKLKILYGEGDAEVLATQAVSMEKAGYTVTQAVGRKAVEQALNGGMFDLVVLGPTLSRNDRHHLPYMVKKASPETSVLVMHADGSRHPYVDACTDTGADMEHVLARIEGMKIAGMMPAAAAAGAGR